MKFQKNNEIWEKIIKNEISHKFNNYVLQLKIHQLQLDYKIGYIALDAAINELFSIYEKYSLLFEKEIKVLISKKVIRKTYTFNEVVEFINNGKILSLAADEQLLKKLPKGNWIGGTIPYFMDTEMGKFSKELIFVDDLTEFAVNFKIAKYNKNTIKNIISDSFINGFTVLIIPYESETVEEFSINSLKYENIYQNPIVGFIAGTDLSNLGKVKAKIYSGNDLTFSEEEGIAIHIGIDSKKIASTEIINLNEINTNSPTIIFPKTSYEQSDCIINGEPDNILSYLTKINYTSGLPLIANFQGALINRDIKVKNIKNNSISFFSPLFKDEKYYLAKPVDDYLNLFEKTLNKIDISNIAYSVLCVSYYGLANLEGKKIPFAGPFTFGEIAYQLLNQTLVYLKIMNK